jgi:hypothetical protein
VAATEPGGGKNIKDPPPEDFAVTQSSDVDGDGVWDGIMGQPAGEDLDNPDPGQVFISSSFMKKNKGGGGIAGGLASDGFTIIGNEPDDYFGAAVAVVNSINGDGYKDLIIGAPNHTNGEGRAFVFYGPFNNPSNPTLYADDADMIFASPDAADYGFGTFVGAVNDINCDGVPDLRIGGFFQSNGAEHQHSYYVSGATGDPLYLAIDSAPFNSWSEVPGDAEGDGDVDRADITIVQRNLGQTGAQLTARDGDFNLDHVVNSTDMAIAQNNLGFNKFTSIKCNPICPPPPADAAGLSLREQVPPQHRRREAAAQRLAGVRSADLPGMVRV